MSLVLFLLFWVNFFFCWPEVVGGGEQDDTKEGEEEIVEGVPTFIILEIGFRHLEILWKDVGETIIA